MHKEIGWYLVEIERILGGKLPESQIQALLSETEEHLLDAAATMAEAGEKEPGRAAIQQFGSVRQFCLAHLMVRGRSSRWDKYLPVAAAAWLCCFPIALIGFIWNDPNPMKWVYLFGAIGICTMAACAFSARSNLWRATSIGTVVGLAASMSFAVFGWLDLGEVDGKTVVSRRELADQQSVWSENILQYQASIAELKRAKEFYQGPRSERYRDFYRTGESRFLLPGDLGVLRAMEREFKPNRYFLAPGNYPGSGPNFGRVGSDNFEAARQQWLTVGNLTLARLRIEAEGYAEMLRDLPDAQNRPLLLQVRSFAPQLLTWAGLVWVGLVILGHLFGRWGEASLLRPRKRSLA